MEINISSRNTAKAIEPARATTSILSDYYQEQLPKLMSLLDSYYAYLNSSGQASHAINNLNLQHDVDITNDEYLEKIRRAIAPSAPQESYLDKQRLYKILLKYYHARGSEESVYAFFKIFYNEIIELWYPKDYLFNTSADKSISSDQFKIQDSYRWQDFSYVIESEKQEVLWKKEYERFVHPAGLKLFIALGISTFNEACGRLSFEDLAKLNNPNNLECGTIINTTPSFAANWNRETDKFGLTARTFSSNPEDPDYGSIVILLNDAPSVPGDSDGWGDLDRSDGELFRPYEWIIEYPAGCWDTPQGPYGIRKYDLLDGRWSLFYASRNSWIYNIDYVPGGVGRDEGVDSPGLISDNARQRAIRDYARSPVSRVSETYPNRQYLNYSPSAGYTTTDERHDKGGRYTIATWIRRTGRFTLLAQHTSSELDPSISHLQRGGYHFSIDVTAEGKMRYRYWERASGVGGFAGTWESAEESVPYDEWCHIAMVYDYDAGLSPLYDEDGNYIEFDPYTTHKEPLKERVRFYINGKELETTVTFNNNLSSSGGEYSQYQPRVSGSRILSTRTSIGGYAGPPGLISHGISDGSLADYRIYATPASPTRVLEMSRGSAPREDDDLQAWYFTNSNDLDDHGTGWNPLMEKNYTRVELGNSYTADTIDKLNVGEIDAGPFAFTDKIDCDPCKWAENLYQFVERIQCAYNNRIQACADIDYQFLLSVLWPDWDNHHLTHIRTYNENPYDIEHGIHLGPHSEYHNTSDWYMQYRPGVYIEERYLRMFYQSLTITLKTIFNHRSQLNLFYKPYIISEKFRDPSGFGDGYYAHTIESTFNDQNNPDEYDPIDPYQFKQYGIGLEQDHYICTRGTGLSSKYSTLNSRRGTSLEFNPDDKLEYPLQLNVVETSVGPHDGKYYAGDWIEYEATISYEEPIAEDRDFISSNLEFEDKYIWGDNHYANSHLTKSDGTHINIPDKEDLIYDATLINYDNLTILTNKPISIISDVNGLYETEPNIITYNISKTAAEIQAEPLVVTFKYKLTESDVRSFDITQIISLLYINLNGYEYNTGSPISRINACVKTSNLSDENLGRLEINKYQLTTDFLEFEKDLNTHSIISKKHTPPLSLINKKELKDFNIIAKAYLCSSPLKTNKNLI